MSETLSCAKLKRFDLSMAAKAWRGAGCVPIFKLVRRMLYLKYFVGLVLIYIRWEAILKWREKRIWLIQLELSLVMCFSLLPFAWAHACRNLRVDAPLRPSPLAALPR